MPYLSKAQAALEQASSLINGPRQEAYGSPRENFERLANGYHEDSVIDAIAYLALMMELSDEPT